MLINLLNLSSKLHQQLYNYWKYPKRKKGSGEPNRNKVGSVTWDQVKSIAEDKMADLNAFSIDSAMMMIAGTARSMGLTVKGGTAPQKK